MAAFFIAGLYACAFIANAQLVFMPNQTANAGNVTSLMMTYSESGKPATPGDKIHFVAVGSDLDSFIHVHAQASNNTTGSFFASVNFPKAGTYVLGLNTESSTGATVAAFLNFTVSGNPAMSPFTPSTLNALDTHILSVPLATPLPAVSLSSLLEKPDAKYHVALSGPTASSCVPGNSGVYSINVMNSSTHAPITDLMPFQGHLVHVAVVAADLSYYAHLHGYIASTSTTKMSNNAGHSHRRMDMDMSDAAFGPVLNVDITFPKNGTYAVIMQMQRGTTEFLASPYYISCTGISGKSSGASRDYGLYLSYFILGSLILRVMAWPQ
jgi:hypothetical protein